MEVKRRERNLNEAQNNLTVHIAEMIAITAVPDSALIWTHLFIRARKE
jgi:hypothetical protein